MKIFPEHWTTGRKAVVIGVVAVAIVYGLSQAGSNEPETTAGMEPSTFFTTVAADARQPTKVASSSYQVEYRVWTSQAQTIDIRWTNESEGTNHTEETFSVGDGAWSQSYDMAAGTFAYLTTNNDYKASSSATINCELRVNGSVIEEQHATGASGGVTCSGRAGQ